MKNYTTQMDAARKGIITPEMKAVAAKEYRTEDADYVMVIMGSAAGTGKDTVDLLRDKGIKAGLLKIRMFRPFPGEEIAEALKNAKVVACMDRTESYNSQDGPIGNDVKAALFNAGMTPKVLNYVYGLAGRDVTVESLGEVFEAMQEVDKSGNVGDTYRYLSLRG